MNKPQKAIELLGPQVEMTNKRLPHDTLLKERLKGIGKAMQELAPARMKHCGSIATHIYLDEYGKQISFIHQHSFDTQPSEKVVSTAVADMSVHLMEVMFNRKKASTRDDRDQRGKKEL